MSNTLIARAFVTSYAIGNEKGFALGKWFDLEDYSDKESFMEAATAYVKYVLGDADPELCFSDNELGFNCGAIYDTLISECGVSAMVWDLFDMTDNDIQILEAYLDNADIVQNSLSDTLEEALEHHLGEYDSAEDYARNHVDSTMDTDSIPEIIFNSIDWKDMGEVLTCNLNICGTHYFSSY